MVTYTLAELAEGGCAVYTSAWLKEKLVRGVRRNRECYFQLGGFSDNLYIKHTRKEKVLGAFGRNRDICIKVVNLFPDVSGGPGKEVAGGGSLWPG
ncbi:hypothetical protein KOW79_003713 [Hemibagrus wyckioides]|uniref:Uncharacterized protein n=1 Tax=Hemibagrus wyckioides TaxID=337641 RepID=A0A9D3P2S7_9TELE|nr:hypothetical protein KOW79_003713 [Hemibagrus wyckioides]